MPSLSCSVEHCDNPVHVKKRLLCMRHYNRFMYAGDLNAGASPVDCGYCGSQLTPSSGPGHPPAYCDATCKRRAAYKRRRDSGAYDLDYSKRRAKFTPKPLTERDCITCMEPFEAKRDDARFCSGRCGTQFKRDNPDGSCITEGCGGTSEARGLCHACYKRDARAAGRMKSAKWSESRKANHHKRRALKLELPAEVIRPLDVYERDEWKCGICAEPVDRDIKYPDPKSPSLDHILPLSRGGHHLMKNVQLAHLDCNVRKGSRVESAVSAMLT